jgi:hypothetical protein
MANGLQDRFIMDFSFTFGLHSSEDEISTYIVALVLTSCSHMILICLIVKICGVLIIYLIFMLKIEGVLVTLLFDHGQLRPTIVCQP